jgi:hypothetical protein
MPHGIHRIVRPALGALIIAASVGAAWAADPAADPGSAMARHRQEWAQHRMEWVRAKLDMDANRLEIKSSQQSAWQEYAKARTALADRNFTRPAGEMDPAAMAKQHAERAAEGARKLAVLADATAKLQSVLSPEQRMTLAQISRHGMRHHGWHGDGHGFRGGFRGDGPGRDGHDGPGAGRQHADDDMQEQDAPAT